MLKNADEKCFNRMCAARCPKLAPALQKGRAGRWHGWFSENIGTVIKRKIRSDSLYFALYYILVYESEVNLCFEQRNQICMQYLPLSPPAPSQPLSKNQPNNNPTSYTS